MSRIGVIRSGCDSFRTRSATMTPMTSGSALVLVRHAMPLVSGDIASRDWPLTEAGRSDAEALARQLDLPAGTPVVSSDELKAKQTAEAFSHEIVIDPRLREVGRPWVEGDYESTARRWLEGESVDGWEPQSDVVKRMTEAVNEAAALAGSEVCLVSHGLAITVLVADMAGVDRVEFWSQLEFPDYMTIDPRCSPVSLDMEVRGDR